MEQKTRVYEILRNFSTTMLVTAEPDKRTEARPMQIAKLDEEGEIWFFAGKSSNTVHEITEEPVVMLIFQDERSAYVSLRGKARVVHERARMRELWQDDYKAWFPDGLDDPNLALLAVEPMSAEYWDNRGSSKLVYLFEAAKAYVAGEPPPVSNEDQYARVNMQNPQK